MQTRIAVSNSKHVIGFCLGAIALSLVLTHPAFAQSTTFSASAETLRSQLFTAAKVVAAIAFIGAGIAKFVGRMNWGAFGAVCVGCCIVAASGWLVTTIFGA